MIDSENSPLSGIDVIKHFVKTLPKKPGVYRMVGVGGQVLYVGKALSLKDRVASYTRLSGQAVRTAQMIVKTVSMEFIITKTETEALLLEASLIKKFKPPYNVLFKDDKSFPFLLIARDHLYSQLRKHRGARTTRGVYFGPFASGRAVSEVLHTLQKVFLVRTCSEKVFVHRTRPCLLYHIKRCSGPCTGEISHEEHEALSAEMEDFLAGKSRALLESMRSKMHKASDEMDFERAAFYRDRLQALSLVVEKQGIHPQNLEEADVFALVKERGMISIQVFFIRAFQNCGNYSYFPKLHEEFSESDILENFLSQFYVDNPIPKRILVSKDLQEKDLLEKAFSLKAGFRVVLENPKKGEKYSFLKHVLQNAHEALARKRAETVAHGEMREKMRQIFNLPRVPERIEIYDNSHIQGAHAFGVMVVAEKEGFLKSEYRTFLMRTHGGIGNDYAMMQEMLTRRFSRLLQEGEAQKKPDLLLIDGGKGQLSQVHQVLENLGIFDVAVLAIAKGPERNRGGETFYRAENLSFSLPSNDPLLYYLQNLRDEAHRFAISTHRKKRSRSLTESVFSEISGIGPKRKKLLLKHFGSAKAVAAASLEELQALKFPSSIIEKIYSHFHE